MDKKLVFFPVFVNWSNELLCLSNDQTHMQDHLIFSKTWLEHKI